MATTKKRIAISLPKDLERALTAAAKRDQIPPATKATELLADALELEEDVILARVAEHRLRTAKRWLTHKEVWSRFGIETK